jgi:ribosomal protein S1
VEDVLQIGQVVKVKILDVDEPMRRISLSLKGMSQAGGELPELNVPGAEVEAAKPKKRKTPLKGGLE